MPPTPKLVPSNVKFASPFKVLAVPEPVITLLSALLFIVVCTFAVFAAIAELIELANLASVTASSASFAVVTVQSASAPVT